MEHDQMTAWVKLFHPRGPQVTLPLPPEAAAALAAVSAALDAGWLVQAPGLEEGEEKEQVGFVLKSIISNEEKETPFVLLYSCNDVLRWSFLKVYLNTEQDQAAFEFASKMKLATMPEYVGQDKPQRGVNHRTDSYIVPAPRPFGVVMKNNPKYNPNETDPKKKKPARLFVRWADTLPTEPPSDRPVSPAEMDELNELMRQWEEVGKKRINIANFIAWLEADSLQNLTRAQWKKGCEDLRGKIAKGVK